MEKVLKIGKTSVKLNNNVAWTMEYRDQFGKDPLEALMPLITAAIEGISTVVSESGLAQGEKVDITTIASALEGRAMDVTLPLMQLGLVDAVINVTWAMAKAADEGIEPPKRWVRQFDSFPLDVILPVVSELMLKGFASSKNLKRLRTLGDDLKKMNQPLQSIPSSSQDLNED